MNHHANQAVEAFIERMGLSAQAEGLPRIAGRMWGYFIIHGGPSSFSELAEQLSVSRGSISTNARLLRELGFIERITKPGDRQDYHQLTDEPYDRLMAGYIQRMHTTADNIEQAQHALPNDWEDAQHRLREMLGFYRTAMTATETLIETLRAECSRGDSGTKT